LVGSVVVPAGTTNGTSQGFGTLTHLAVVGIVFSDPTCFSNSNCQYIVVLANGARFTHGVGSAVGVIAVPAESTIDAGNGIRGLSKLSVDGIDVFAGAANFAILLSQLIIVLANVTINAREVQRIVVFS
jgi:hypothetical protein